MAWRLKKNGAAPQQGRFNRASASEPCLRPEVETTAGARKSTPGSPKPQRGHAQQGARQGGTEPGTTRFRDGRKTTRPPAPRRGPAAPAPHARARGPDLESAHHVDGVYISLSARKVLLLWVSAAKRWSFFELRSLRRPQVPRERVARCAGLGAGCGGKDDGVSKICNALNFAAAAHARQTQQDQVDGVYAVLGGLRKPGQLHALCRPPAVRPAAYASWATRKRTSASARPTPAQARTVARQAAGSPAASDSATLVWNPFIEWNPKP